MKRRQEQRRQALRLQERRGQEGRQQELRWERIMATSASELQPRSQFGRPKALPNSAQYLPAQSLPARVLSALLLPALLVVQYLQLFVSVPAGAERSMCAAIFCSSAGSGGPQQCGAPGWNTISPVHRGDVVVRRKSYSRCVASFR